MHHAHLDLTDRHPPTPPPCYTPSLHSVPSYAVEPSEDEESLDTGIRPQTPIPRGEFTAKAGNVTVSLHEQEFGAGIPTYRQKSIIKGSVAISGRVAVVAVSVKLEGRQTWAIADVGRCERLLFSETHELWRKSLQGDSIAPTVFDFQVPFPYKFVDKAYSNPLIVPPSFEIKFHEEPGVSLRNEYTLITTVTVARPGSWSKQESLILPIILNYRPRSRPYLPIPDNLLPFFATSKTMPEQWYQTCFCFQCKSGLKGPMECHLFIPHTQIYALRDTIPFHVHLRGSAESLRGFLGDTAERSFSPFEQHPSTSSATVRVYIRRRVSVVVKGIRAYQGVIIGEGKLRAVERPPDWSPSPCALHSAGMQRASCSSVTDEYSLDWEGEVTCDDNTTVPSFVSGEMYVKDFIVVQLCPVDVGTATYVEHRHCHVIRLVTDKYRDAHPSEA